MDTARGPLKALPNRKTVPDRRDAVSAEAQSAETASFAFCRTRAYHAE
ncbi:hypothetical protein [Streptomyces chartreusis]